MGLSRGARGRVRAAHWSEGTLLRQGGGLCEEEVAGSRAATRVGWRRQQVSMLGCGAFSVRGRRGKREGAGPQLLVRAPGFSTPSDLQCKGLRGARVRHYGA